MISTISSTDSKPYTVSNHKDENLSEKHLYQGFFFRDTYTGKDSVMISHY